jgi:hypothetical protein
VPRRLGRLRRGGPPRCPKRSSQRPLAVWTAANLEHIRHCKCLVTDHRGPLNRYVVSRVGRAAGVLGVHPHRLRHTLTTQAINRGMRLEAIAAPHIKHRKMEMTLIYTRIATRVVADEYAAVSAKTGAPYGQPPALPAGYETTGMARLRREAVRLGFLEIDFGRRILAGVVRELSLAAVPAWAASV